MQPPKRYMQLVLKIFKCQIGIDDWGFVSSDVSRSGDPRVLPSLGFGVNTFKCQVGVDDWGFVPLTFPKRQHTRQFFIGL